MTQNDVSARVANLLKSGPMPSYVVKSTSIRLWISRLPSFPCIIASLIRARTKFALCLKYFAEGTYCAPFCTPLSHSNRKNLQIPPTFRKRTKHLCPSTKISPRFHLGNAGLAKQTIQKPRHICIGHGQVFRMIHRKEIETKQNRAKPSTHLLQSYPEVCFLKLGLIWRSNWIF